MMAGLSEGALSDELMTRANAWREPLVGPASEEGSYKEWMHFCVRLPGGHLLVNLNVTECDDGTALRKRPRLFVLAVADGWSGGIESFADGRVRGRPGQLAFELGKNSMRWRSGAFELKLHTPQVEAELRLRAASLPTLASSVSLGAERKLNWVVVPRLEADGWVTLNGRRCPLEGALSYHDHNWGQFRWGKELSWEWGFFHPEASDCPWHVVLARVSDGARHRTLSQAALLWQGDRLLRVFQNREINFELVGAHREAQPFTVPKVARLLVPGESSGVPQRFRLYARQSLDELSVAFDVRESARIVLPSESDPFGLVVLNETSGRGGVSGRVGSESFDFGAAAMMEFVRG